MKLNALLVDPELLGDEGWEYLDRIASVLPDLGLVVCTGRSTVAQRVRGLRLGVDDWITKPCHPEEAIARIEAVTRRRRQGSREFEASPVAVGELEIRPDRFQAFVGDDALDLTRREFELLHLLAEERGQVLERETIYQRVWGYAMAHGDRSVDVFIRKLRQKLEKHSPSWAYIHTHFGIGYRLRPRTGRDRRGGAAARPPSRAVARRRRVVHRSFTRPSRRGNRRAGRSRHARRAWLWEPRAAHRDSRPGACRSAPSEHAALVDGRPLSLTMRELQLLVTLSAHPQRIMTREELFTEVWGRTAAARRPLGRRLRQPPARQARRGAARAAADPHPQRHRLPLLARWLTSPWPARQPFYIFFTSSIQPGNKLPGPLRAWPGRSGVAADASSTTTEGDRCACLKMACGVLA